MKMVTEKVDKSLLDKSEEIQENKERRNSKEKWYTIDINMIPAKICFFIQAGSMGLFRPYVILFLINSGLTASESGIINGLCYVGAIVGAPLWGFLADKYHAYKRIFLIILFFAMISICSQPFISYSIGDEIFNKCPQPFNQTTLAFYQDMYQAKSFSSNLFWVLLFMSITSYVFDGSISGFLDAGIVQKINTCSNKPQFGRQRLYGSIGFGVGALLGSISVDMFPKMSLNCYASVFVGYFILIILLMVSVLWLFRGLKFRHEKHVSNFAVLKSTLLQGDVQFYFLSITIVGVEQALYVFFTNVYLKTLQASNVLNGISFAVAAFSCVLTLNYAQYLIKMFGSTWRSLAFCCFTYVLRFITVGFITNPWFILIVQPLQAFGLGLFIATNVEHIRVISQPSILTTMYSINTACQYSISYIIANIVGGKVYNEYGGRVLFLSGGILALVWTVLMGVFIIVHERKTTGAKKDIELKELRSI